ncbi:MAG: site-specific DNA-methyltransferase, partial [Prevotellaceae bacterium]|nr:site-specific DNA-methyltransferase [Prevotellaceae bacterium]
LTDENSWVLDPFAGVGSTIIGAVKNNRNAIGIEKEKYYCEIANKRLNDLRKGYLKIRPITQPIHSPSERDKIAQFPMEWKQLAML